jgi:hypothetical protein
LGETTTSFALSAANTAANPAGAPAPRLIGRARIDNKDVVHEAGGEVPRVLEPGDITVATDRVEVAIAPGSQAQITARVERHNGFQGRVPLDVRGLPHGVRVLDIGLNGILVTEKETTRIVVLEADPWVKPTAHPFVLLARHEGKNVEYAAPSILLRVRRPD